MTWSGAGTTLSQTERRPRVATLTVVEICLAEGALTVVTASAGLGARVWKMLRWEGRRDLLAFWQSAPPDRVAVLATEILSRSVSRVAEA